VRDRIAWQGSQKAAVDRFEEEPLPRVVVVGGRSSIEAAGGCGHGGSSVRCSLGPDKARYLEPRSPLFTRVRGREILRTSPVERACAALK
jgi:hypothetical protein